MKSLLNIKDIDKLKELLEIFENDRQWEEVSKIQYRIEFLEEKLSKIKKPFKLEIWFIVMLRLINLKFLCNQPLEFYVELVTRLDNDIKRLEKNMNDFHNKTNCDRCKKSLDEGRIMSWFTDETICLDCSDKENLIKKDLINAGKNPYSYEGCGYIPYNS